MMKLKYRSVAQLARAPVSKTGGWGFESLRSCQILGKKMLNPLKFIQSVKQEAFRVTWPTKRDVLIGSLMVFVLATIAAIFFLLLDQVYRVLLDLILNINI